MEENTLTFEQEVNENFIKVDRALTEISNNIKEIEKKLSLITKQLN